MDAIKSVALAPIALAPIAPNGMWNIRRDQGSKSGKQAVIPSLTSSGGRKGLDPIIEQRVFDGFCLDRSEPNFLDELLSIACTTIGSKNIFMESDAYLARMPVAKQPDKIPEEIKRSKLGKLALRVLYQQYFFSTFAHGAYPSPMLIANISSLIPNTADLTGKQQPTKCKNQDKSVTRDMISMADKYKKFEAYYESGLSQQQVELAVLRDLYDLPNGEMKTIVDHRLNGGVSPVVRDQGESWACWAITCAGAIEGLVYYRNGELIPLSPQYLVDYYGRSKGGYFPEHALQQIETGGICSEEEYPWLDGFCHGRKRECNPPSTFIDGYDIFSGEDDDTRMVEVIMEQPFICEVYALPNTPIHDKLVMYEVIDYLRAEGLEFRLDHAVLIVGLVSFAGKDFWILKNSYGVGWGMRGYALMERVSGTGVHGMNVNITIPLIKKED